MSPTPIAEKLLGNGYPYLNWRDDMKITLMDMKLWELTDEAYYTSQVNEATNNNDPNHPIFAKNVKAAATIRGWLAANQSHYIRGMDDAHQLWKALENVHLASLYGIRRHAEEKLRTMKMDRMTSPEDLDKHLLAMGLAYDQLISSGSEMPFEEFSMITVFSLPKEFGMLQCLFLNRQVICNTMDQLHSTIKSNYKHHNENIQLYLSRNHGNQHAGRESGRFGSIRGRGNQFGSRANQSFKCCWYCRGTNHTRPQCFKLQRDQQMGNVRPDLTGPYAQNQGGRGFGRFGSVRGRGRGRGNQNLNRASNGNYSNGNSNGGNGYENGRVGRGYMLNQGDETVTVSSSLSLNDLPYHQRHFYAREVVFPHADAKTLNQQENFE